jgi:hypothetical protein
MSWRMNDQLTDVRVRCILKSAQVMDRSVWRLSIEDEGCVSVGELATGARWVGPPEAGSSSKYRKFEQEPVGGQI